ncbi:MAG: flagellar hook-basal body protein [Cyanobacteria bacterium NC_groundwater_1444_Ag_S-0.65um_54_12]|nr:flagellar hook-basal body protein [Cyanobacteria bacterium NC_groundwater_1444_Ag_S-0.65um_54_12]
MMVQMGQQDVIGNNLANLNTAGFKKDHAAFRARLDKAMYRVASPQNGQSATMTQLGMISAGATIDQISSSYSQGELRQTDNPLDLGLKGQGFLAVKTEQGVAYTRNGACKIDEQSRLVNGSGHAILGQGGEIYLPGKGKVQIGEDGAITVDGTLVDHLRLVNVNDPLGQLQKRGDSYYYLVSGSEEAATELSVQQGFLESSTVNPIQEMVSMITAMRTYEGSQRALSSQDEVLGRAVNDIARL